MLDRHYLLLRAARDMLRVISDEEIPVPFMSTHDGSDGTDIVGLVTDIETVLGIDPDEPTKYVVRA